ncbi:MAG: carbohydrate ABC transporter permease [Bacteroidetes bacterium]|jgi:putative chitobiose transport system permease protein|nr:carbohydrate ABC transporter permease [Bacteroidota bacterium]
MRRAIRWAFMASLIVVLTGPFVWMVSTSLKGTEEIFAVPPTLIPADPQWTNFSEVWRQIPFGTYALNSLIVACAAVALMVGLSAAAAFPLARMQFRGRSIIMGALLASLLIPEQVLLVPLYGLVMQLGLLNTLPGIVLPFAVNAFGILYLRQYYMTIPRELDDAAAIDGCSPWRYWWTILLPLSKPALGSLAVLTFVSSWNSLLWPLIVVRDASVTTLPVGLTGLSTAFSANFRLVAAGAVLSLLPAILVYVVGQKALIEGLTRGGVKG